MTSYLEILKNLQSSQNSQNNNNAQLTKIQSQDQPDLNLQQLQSDQKQYSYSFIEYVPFQRKVIQMQEKVFTQRIPKTKIIAYEVEEIFVQRVPKQKILTDYFAVQYLRYYKKEIIPERTIEYVPVVRTIKKMEFVPVERKIVHYPKDIQSESINPFDEQTLICKTIEKNAQTQKRREKTFTPIKQFYPEDSDFEVPQNDSSNSSILDSLSKAYTPEPSTEHGERSRTGTHKYADPVSPFQITRKRRPSTFLQVNYRSTETIDSKYFMGL